MSRRGSLTKAELEDRVEELEEENQGLQDRLDAIAEVVNDDEEDEQES